MRNPLCLLPPNNMIMMLVSWVTVLGCRYCCGVLCRRLQNNLLASLPPNIVDNVTQLKELYAAWMLRLLLLAPWCVCAHGGGVAVLRHMWQELAQQLLGIASRPCISHFDET